MKKWCEVNPYLTAGIAILALLTLASSPAACYAILGIAVVHELVELYKFLITARK